MRPQRLPRRREAELLARRAAISELREYLEIEGDAVAAELGVSQGDVSRWLVEPDHLLMLNVRRAAERCRIAEARSKARSANAVAQSAAEAVARTARWTPSGIVLAPELLLGDVLAARDREYIVFQFDEGEVAVHSAVLRRARTALNDMPDVTVTVYAGVLHIGWRGGRGGLRLRHCPMARNERDSVVVVHLIQRSDAVAAVERPPPLHRNGAWLCDLLTDVLDQLGAAQ